MIGANCSVNNTPSIVLPMLAQMDARHLSQDYDTMQGYAQGLWFFPMTAPRLFANVPQYFGPNAKFDNKAVTCIELIDGINCPHYGGVDMPQSFVNGWLNLVDNCGNLLLEVPMSSLNRVLNGDKPFYLRKMPVDWTKSFLRFTDVTGLASSGFLFNIWTV